MGQPPVRSPARHTEMAVRLALVILAFYLFWAASQLRQDLTAELNATGELSLWSWFLVPLLGVPAGFMFAVAGRPALGRWTYRWSIALALAAIPLAILTLSTLFHAGLLGQPPRFLFRPVILAVDLALAAPISTLIGVGLASGLVSREGSDRGGGLGVDVRQAGT